MNCAFWFTVYRSMLVDHLMQVMFLFLLSLGLLKLQPLTFETIQCIVMNLLLSEFGYIFLLCLLRDFNIMRESLVVLSMSH